MLNLIVIAYLLLLSLLQLCDPPLKPLLFVCEEGQTRLDFLLNFLKNDRHFVYQNIHCSLFILIVSLGFSTYHMHSSPSSCVSQLWGSPTICNHHRIIYNHRLTYFKLNPPQCRKKLYSISLHRLIRYHRPKNQKKQLSLGLHIAWTKNPLVTTQETGSKNMNNTSKTGKYSQYRN